MKLLDAVLFPKDYYRKLNDSKLTLYAGMILVGAIDLLQAFDVALPNYFLDKPQNVLTMNVALSIIYIILIGFMDVLFFTFPLYDLLQFFTRKAGLKSNVSIVKIGKAYISTHFIVTPVNALAYFLIIYFNLASSSKGIFVDIIGAYFMIIMPIWFAAIVTRGLNVLYNVAPRYKLLLFLVVFLWNELMGMALGFASGTYLNAFLK